MNKLWVRLSLAFGSVVLLAVLLVTLTGILVGRAEAYGDPPAYFLQTSNNKLADELARYYQAHHSWAGVELVLAGAQAAFRTRPSEEATLFLADQQEQIIYPIQPEWLGQPIETLEQSWALPIRVDEQTVGYLGVISSPRSDRFDWRRPSLPFLNRFLLSLAAVAGVTGVVVGVLMSRSLSAPLNRLAEGAKAIGARNFSRRVEMKGSDEIQQVARAFNEMAAALEENEQLRRNLLADVAHELRTPLTVLQGNLRAILDEVYPLDQAEITRLYEQTRFLSRLVNDLHELAQAEAKQLPLNISQTDLLPLIKTVGETFSPIAEEKSIRLHIELPAALPLVEIDAARLSQVLHNLLSNSLRHTPAGGAITLRAETGPEAVELAVADTGDGIPAEHLPHVFDRFYRADPARSRDRGGAGLGLAIARAIVEAHGGKISVASQGIPGHGSVFTIRLPLVTNS
jgi:signal transduction histidine kinase